MPIISTDRRWNYQEYTTAGTYSFVVPAGVTRLVATLVGGGGGGGGGTSYNNAGAASGGGGGGAGAVMTPAAFTVYPGEVITITNGAGGAAGTGGVSNGAGGAGGNGTPTSVSRGSSTIFIAYSGGGGGGGTASSNRVLKFRSISVGTAA